MVKVADLPSFDMAESLKTEEDIVMYLNIVLEENDLTGSCSQRNC